MPTITDHDQIIQDLRARLEESEHERERLTIAIADHVEALGFEGRDADALVDARGQIERLLEGKDLDDDFEGVAGRVAALYTQHSLLSRLLTPAILAAVAGVVSVLQSACEQLGQVDVAALLVHAVSDNDGS